MNTDSRFAALRLHDLLRHMTDTIAASNDADVSMNAALDARILLAYQCGIDTKQLLSERSSSLTVLGIDETKYAQSLDLAKQRAQGYPVAYIVGSKEFFGREFLVDERVLIPRPETETLIEWLIETVEYEKTDNRIWRIHDICTGSGAIPITVSLELETRKIKAIVDGSDISEPALDVARINEKHLCMTGQSTHVNFFRSDLFSTLKDSCDVITANPPYVPSVEAARTLDRGWKEPLSALDGGVSGVEIPLRCIDEAWHHLKPGAWFFLEFGDGQAAAVLDLLQRRGYVSYTVRTDLSGLERIARARRPV